ncbi:MAG: serine hydrolase [Nanoarchaeota archaeon]|nr:serine hydrolase [Nanoarchaeota archaeon]
MLAEIVEAATSGLEVAAKWLEELPQKGSTNRRSFLASSAAGLGLGFLTKSLYASQGSWSVSYSVGKNTDDLKEKEKRISEYLQEAFDNGKLNEFDRKNLEIVPYKDRSALIYRLDTNRSTAGNISEDHEKILKAKDEKLDTAGIDLSATYKPKRKRLPKKETIPKEEFIEEGLSLQEIAEKRIEQLRNVGENIRNRDRIRITHLAPDEEISFLVYDILEDKELINVNGDLSMRCASMVKPLVALAFLHQLRRFDQYATWKYDEKSKKFSFELVGGTFTTHDNATNDLVNFFLKDTKNLSVYAEKLKTMLNGGDWRASNKATNYLMRALGGPDNVEKILRESYGDIFKDIKINSYIPEKRPNEGAEYNNRASARDYSRMLQALWKDELPGSEIILGIMGMNKKKNHGRIFHDVDEIPKETEAHLKTGTTKMSMGEMGIINAIGETVNMIGGDNISEVTEMHPYIVVGNIEKTGKNKGYGGWSTNRGNILREFSGRVYRRLQSLYNLKKAA